MSDLQVFLDQMPGETRGVIVRNGRFDSLIIHRDNDPPTHRLGARSVGRVTRVDGVLKGVFVDLGVGEEGFLPSRQGDRLNVGEKLEVLVSAEPREAKGPTLSVIGSATGDVRLLGSGPSVVDLLGLLAPGIEPQAGIAAMRAVMDAEDEATSRGGEHSTSRVNVSVERTRALIAVDIDHAAGAGRDVRREKAKANREGLFEAARLIRLKGWGGLVAIDLIGVGQDGAETLQAAKEAFGTDHRIVFGPVNRFGVLMMSLPWGFTPLEERLNGAGGSPSVETRALRGVRQLRLALAENTAAPYLTLRCSPAEAILAEPWVRDLGPRARVVSDAAVTSAALIDEG